MNHNNNRVCMQCQRPLRGRSDKKFCNDQCRNCWNNSHSDTHLAEVRRINAILLRNRRILDQFLSGAPRMLVYASDLQFRGFQFAYTTHHLHRKGKSYQCCYEFGWTEMSGGRLRLVCMDRLMIASAIKKATRMDGLEER